MGSLCLLLLPPVRVVRLVLLRVLTALLLE
jgi:hypothetical protein